MYRNLYDDDGKTIKESNSINQKIKQFDKKHQVSSYFLFPLMKWHL